MRSRWIKAGVLLASCCALIACERLGTGTVSVRPRSVGSEIPRPGPGQTPAAPDAEPGQYDLLKLAQPADRVVEF